MRCTTLSVVPDTQTALSSNVTPVGRSRIATEPLTFVAPGSILISRLLLTHATHTAPPPDVMASGRPPILIVAIILRVTGLSLTTDPPSPSVTHMLPKASTRSTGELPSVARYILL